MKESIILVGAGGHCESIIDAIESMDEFHIVGILDKTEKIGEVVEGIKITGNDDNLLELINGGITKCFVSIGSIGNYSIRKKAIDKINEIGYCSINVIDPSAVISKSAKIGKGVFVGKNCVINSGAIIGDYAIINTGAIIEHDCLIESFVHIAPGSVIAGNCKIGYGTHIGINSSVIQNVEIGKNCMIGAGSVVLTKIADNERKYGIIKENKK